MNDYLLGIYTLCQERFYTEGLQTFSLKGETQCMLDFEVILVSVTAEYGEQAAIDNM